MPTSWASPVIFLGEDEISAKEISGRIWPAARQFTAKQDEAISAIFLGLSMKNAGQAHPRIIRYLYFI